jgi:hypothetical protein
MALFDPNSREKSREWRRSVRVKARIKSPEGWRDASILNVSSRGLMIHSTCCSNPGGEVELRGGDQVIRARVVWRKGQRAGLRSDMVLPVIDILNLGDGGEGKLALEAARRAGRCTRSNRSESFTAGYWTRLLELGSVLAIGAMIVIGLVTMGASLLLEHLGAVSAALGR